jgi:cell division protease FtsH
VEGHHQLAELLIDREVIFSEDVERIFGKRPWTSRADELISETGPVAEKQETIPETPATEEPSNAQDQEETLV